jgi:hypothetical protein
LPLAWRMSSTLILVYFLPLMIIVSPLPLLDFHLPVAASLLVKTPTTRLPRMIFPLV